MAESLWGKLSAMFEQLMMKNESLIIFLFEHFYDFV